MNKNYSYALMFFGFIVLRKLFDKSLLVGIAVGMLLSFFILKGNIVESISNFADFTNFTGITENMEASSERSNSNSKLLNINGDSTIKELFKDISNYGTENNYININDGLQHIEQFLKIKKNITKLENKKQFYDLAKMERKKGLDSIISAMVTMNPKDSKKLKRIVKYLGKITKKYLLHIGNIVNKEWNEGYVDETSGVVHLD